MVEFDPVVRRCIEREFGISFSAILKATHVPGNYQCGYGFEDRVIEAILRSPRGREMMAKNARKRLACKLYEHLSHGYRPAPPGRWEFRSDNDPEDRWAGQWVWVEEQREGQWTIDDLALCDTAGLEERFTMIARQLAPKLDLLEYYSCYRQWGDRFIKAAGFPTYDHANRMAKARQLVHRARVYRAVLSDYTDDDGNPRTGGHSNYDLSEEEQVAAE